MAPREGAVAPRGRRHLMRQAGHVLRALLALGLLVEESAAQADARGLEELASMFAGGQGMRGDFGAGGAGGMDGLGALLQGLAGGGAGGGRGPLCPAGKTPVPAKDSHKAYSANGCGPQGFQVQEPYGLYKCCNFHDVCFSVCGTTHEWCEREFNRCLKRVCKNPIKGETGDCRKQAASFTSLTGSFGQSFHTSSQRMSCQCVDAGVVADKHQEYLTAFLEEYDPPEASPENTQQMLTKWKGKEGIMYALLAKKYGKSFVHFNNVAPEFEEAPPKKQEL